MRRQVPRMDFRERPNSGEYAAAVRGVCGETQRQRRDDRAGFERGLGRRRHGARPAYSGGLTSRPLLAARRNFWQRVRDERASLSPQACVPRCVHLWCLAARGAMSHRKRASSVHQIWPRVSRDDAVAGNYSAKDLVAVQRDLGALAKYVIEMGGNIELFEMALRIPPWEILRPLDSAEVDRVMLRNVDDPFSSSARVATRPPELVDVPRHVRWTSWTGPGLPTMLTARGASRAGIPLRSKASRSGHSNFRLFAGLETLTLSMWSNVSLACGAGRPRHSRRDWCRQGARHAQGPIVVWKRHPASCGPSLKFEWRRSFWQRLSDTSTGRHW